MYHQNYWLIVVFPSRAVLSRFSSGVNQDTKRQKGADEIAAAGLCFSFEAPWISLLLPAI
jgi:hypothetical protein